MCHLWQHTSRSIDPQNHVVNSWSKGTCRKERSHISWPLKDVPQTICCNICAQELGDLQKFTSHFGLTLLPVPAPTIRGSAHAQLVSEPRRNRQHSRDGHEWEARVRQERRRQNRRGTAKPKAAPRHRQSNQQGWREPVAQRQ